MKLNFYQTCKVILLCVLFTETIICSKTETATEGRFLMKAGFLKHKKVAQTVPGSVHRNTAPRSETMNLMQKSEVMKKAAFAKQDMGAMESVAKQLANKPTNPNDPAPLDLNIGTGPVWVTGWIKYFKYFPSAKTLNLTPNNTPRQYMVNPQYNEQYKVNPKFDKKEKSKDDMGNDLAVYITDNHKFYSKLVKDQIIILSARDVRIIF